jgi:hypothetical protein
MLRALTIFAMIMLLPIAWAAFDVAGLAIWLGLTLWAASAWFEDGAVVWPCLAVLVLVGWAMIF